MNLSRIVIVLLASMLLTACQTTNSQSINRVTVGTSNSVVASWYQAGHRTASGQRFDPNGNTVAHRTLPFGTKLKLTNPSNGRSIIATVNDRGPFIRGTGLDVARGGAHRLGFINKGKTKLIMQVMH